MTHKFTTRANLIVGVIIFLVFLPLCVAGQTEQQKQRAEEFTKYTVPANDSFIVPVELFQGKVDFTMVYKGTGDKKSLFMIYTTHPIVLSSAERKKQLLGGDYTYFNDKLGKPFGKFSILVPKDSIYYLMIINKNKKSIEFTVGTRYSK